MSAKIFLLTLTLVGTWFCLTASLPSNIRTIVLNSLRVKDTVNQDPEEEATTTTSTTTEPPPPPPPPRSRRSARGLPRIQERLVSRAGSPFQIVHVEHKGSAPHRRKRAVYTDKERTWPHNIPFQINPDYPEDLAIKLLGILVFIEKHLCVSFFYEPDFDINNNAYGLKSYLYFTKEGSECDADHGRGTSGSRRVRTCSYWNTMTHEIFHALGAIHEQQSPLARFYLYSQPANIDSGLYYNFVPKDEEIVEASVFDPSNVLLYDQLLFTGNGLPSINSMRDDLFAVNDGIRDNFDSAFYELNKVYNCSAVACGGASVDCGKNGYYTKVNGQCKCACADGFDSSSSCTSLIDTTSSPDWPDAPIIMWAADGSGCPAGMDSGLIRMPFTVIEYSDPSFKSGDFLQLWYCSKPSTRTDMGDMPMGQYCVVKPVGVDCFPLTYGSYSMASSGIAEIHGNVGDIDVNDGGHNITFKYCCRSDRGLHHALNLPNAHNLRMLVRKSSACPWIRGLAHRKSRTSVITYGMKKSGTIPLSNIGSYYANLYSCMYYVPEYGCNQVITLVQANPSITINTPVDSGGKRVANKRCLYYFDVPTNSRLSLKFDDFRIDDSDYFGIRRYNPWVKPLRVHNYDYPRHVLSENDFLFLEFWSYIDESTAPGVKFTVKLISDMCYDDATRGSEYMGNKWTTEKREACIPWTDAFNCPNFPYDGLSMIHLKKLGNKCRNPKGDLKEPWCYTFVDGTYCQKRYCDVCNYADDGDLFPDCAAMVQEDPGFCENSVQRLSCASYCNIFINPPPPVATCPDGWNAHGDRCWKYFDGLRTQADSEKHCNENNGTIFRIRNEADVELIMNFQGTATSSEAQGNLWANGRYMTTKAQYLTLGDQQRLPWMQLASQASDQNHNLFIRALGQTEEGRLDTASSSTTYAAICEIPLALTFGPPTIPAGAEIVAGQKSEYRPGDRVTLKCFQGANGNQVTLECGTDGWIDVPTLCPECPTGWTPYKDRCWFWSSTASTQAAAQDMCASHQGSLFKIRDNEDMAMIRNFKANSGLYGANWNTWINAKLDLDDDTYYTLDDHTEVDIPEWASSADQYDSSEPCVFLLGEDKSEAGEYSTASTSATYRTFCEVTRHVPPSADSTADSLFQTCQNMLAVNPAFCGTLEASFVCREPCGLDLEPAPSVSNECPSGWMTYESRCYKWFGQGKTQADAESTCNEVGSTVTIFQIHKAEDIEVMRTYLQNSDEYGSKWNNWLSGKRGSDGKWYTLNDNRELTYYDWADDAGSGDLLYLLGEDKSEKGKYALAGSSSKFRFFCQFTLSPASGCAAPTTLVKSHATESAVQFGQVMNFECDANYLYLKGDKQRACLSDGTLFGEDLVCSDTPRLLNLNDNELIRRRSFVYLNTAYVFNVTSLTMPHDGTIVSWNYYASVGGEAAFLVFRYDGVSKTYSLVGQNTVDITHTNYKWSTVVPAGERINVQKGDYVGLYSTEAHIVGDHCYSSALPNLVVGVGSDLSLADLANPLTPKYECLVPSVGAGLYI